jgi:hypothetical protein
MAIPLKRKNAGLNVFLICHLLFVALPGDVFEELNKRLLTLFSTIDK